MERVPQVEQEHQERRPDEPGDAHRAYRGGPDRDRHGVARGGPGRVAGVGQAQRRRPIAEEASDDRVGDGEEREVAERERRDRSARLLEAGQAAGYDRGDATERDEGDHQHRHERRGPILRRRALGGRHDPGLDRQRPIEQDRHERDRDDDAGTERDEPDRPDRAERGDGWNDERFDGNAALGMRAVDLGEDLQRPDDGRRQEQHRHRPDERTRHDRRHANDDGDDDLEIAPATANVAIRGEPGCRPGQVADGPLETAPDESAADRERLGPRRRRRHSGDRSRSGSAVAGPAAAPVSRRSDRASRPPTRAGPPANAY